MFSFDPEEILSKGMSKNKSKKNYSFTNIQDLKNKKNINSIFHMKKEYKNIILIGEIHPDITDINYNDQYLFFNEFIIKFVNDNNCNVSLLLEDYSHNIKDSPKGFGVISKVSHIHNINITKCDERLNIPVIKLISNHSIKDDQIIEDMLRTIELITTEDNTFINFIKDSLSNYNLNSKQLDCIYKIHNNNMLLYKEKYNNVFYETLEDLLDSDKNNFKSNIEDFELVSKLYFSIILDWVMLYYIENNSTEIIFCYAGDHHITNLYSSLEYLGYINQK